MPGTFKPDQKSNYISGVCVHTYIHTIDFDNMIVIIIMIGGQMAACGAMGPVKSKYLDNRRSSEHSRCSGTKKKITSALRLLPRRASVL